ncbi:MAG: thioredoxin family protein [Thermostichales cyanobacterium BF4_bins_65]
MDTHPLIGQYAPDFELPGVDGEVYHLRRLLPQYQAVVVVIMCNHCPYVQAAIDTLKNIQSDYQGRVLLIGVNPNDDQRYPQDSFANMKLFAEERQLNFPYLRDPTQDVAKAFDAKVTPEVFLIDPQGIVRYAGGVEERYPEVAQAGQPSGLRLALEQFLNQQPVTVNCQAMGCTVKWKAA